MLGGSGKDLLDGGEGADVIFGGRGSDTVDYSSRTQPVWVNLGDDLPGDGFRIINTDTSGPTRIVVAESIQAVIE